MKIKLITCLSVIALLAIGCNTKKEKETNPTNDGRTEIIVSYERQEGWASNQYAVWIENEAGDLIKTIFVTEYTAQGNYTIRPECTPTWVKKAGPQDFPKEKIDAYSGATPQTGVQTYTWDLTNDNGEKVTPGTYKAIVEGTLFGASEVFFRGDIHVGGAEAESTPTPEFTSEDPKNKNMITSVLIKYIHEK